AEQVVRMQRYSIAIVLAAIAWCQAPAAAQRQDPAAPPDGDGRVVATVTMFDGTVNVPGVDLELRTATDPSALARSVTDGAGQVPSPDVPAGRYVIVGSRPGFVSRSSAEFEVRPGVASRVLLDLQVTFVLPTVEVRADTPSPTNSMQPVSLSD